MVTRIGGGVRWRGQLWVRLSWRLILVGTMGIFTAWYRHLVCLSALVYGRGSKEGK